MLSVHQHRNPIFSMFRAEGVNPGIPLYLPEGEVLLTWVSPRPSAFLVRLSARLRVVSGWVSVRQAGRVVRQGKSKPFDRIFIGLVRHGWYGGMHRCRPFGAC